MSVTKRTTPSVLAGAVRPPGLVPVPMPTATGADGGSSSPRPSQGDLLTVDPEDRRRRARVALLELAVSRTTQRRRAV